MGKRQDVRADLTVRILNSAISHIQIHGLKGLRARDIAIGADCGLGTLYKCYVDLDDLIMRVNSKTLQRLLEHMQSVADKEPNPNKRLENLAIAYAEFAMATTALWSTIFDHELPATLTLPDWHNQDQANLLMIIAKTLGEVFPNSSQETLMRRAKTTFSAAHGIVAFALQDRFSGVLEDELEQELSALSRMILSVDP